MSYLGGLKVSTPTEREIVLTREFDAPRGLVFDAMSKAELLNRWLLGPPDWSMIECESDPRVGGTFRHVWRDPEGAEIAMHGVYLEVVPPERIVRTEAFDLGGGVDSGEQVGTLVLSEQGAKTALTLTLAYPSQEARDAAVASGMERGVAASYDRLEELLVTNSA